MKSGCSTSRILLAALLVSGVVFKGQAQPCTASPYRTYDGSCNNLQQPDWGKAGTFYARGPEVSHAQPVVGFLRHPQSLTHCITDATVYKVHEHLCLRAPNPSCQTPGLV